MKKYKVGLVGYFATGKSKAGGQEAKTCSLDKSLKERYGKEMVFDVDTTNWKKKPFSLLIGLFKLCLKCENVIMLPAQNSIRIFIPFILFFNTFFQRKIFYSVVGGWLPEYLEKNIRLCKKAKKLTGIFVETNSMKKKLDNMNFKNVDVIPNFKVLEPIEKEELNMTFEMPYFLCTFSRVMKEKGIEDIVDAVININNKYKKEIYKLDIYGKIDDGYQIEFEKISKQFPNYIRYMGMVEPHESVKVIKNYFALVFPTKYYTEGMPGTLIDAYMAGVPVISSLWGNYEDVFIDNVTGWGYEFSNNMQLEKLLEKIINNPNDFIKMKETTLENSKKYTSKIAIAKICEKFI